MAQLWVTFGQNVIVVDASVVAVALGDDGADGERARIRLTVLLRARVAAPARG